MDLLQRTELCQQQLYIYENLIYLQESVINS